MALRFIKTLLLVSLVTVLLMPAGFAAAPVVYDKWGYIGKSGNMVIPLQFAEAEEFSEGLAGVRMEVEPGYFKNGYIDKNGNVVIPPQFDRSLKFSEGLAGVKVNDKWGFVDMSGTMIVPAEYQEDPALYGANSGHRMRYNNFDQYN